MIFDHRSIDATPSSRSRRAADNRRRTIEVLTASLADSPKFHRPDAALRGCFLLALSAACTCAAKPCFLCTDWRSRISFRCLYYPQGSNCASLYGKLDPR
eukprot:TRINITY_DN10342_c0_g1_i1.p1 TRINITY_DN10342_c0_g1~~TRINITY_DN10342_c0_g1_i1.p1  ORF type:complete len:100 (-),score=4.87 TRINITY_DN10342_c0_g1_i1:323-622(-)